MKGENVKASIRRRKMWEALDAVPLDVRRWLASVMRDTDQKFREGFAEVLEEATDSTPRIGRDEKDAR